MALFLGAAFELTRSGGVPFLLLRTRSRHSQYYGSFFLTSLDYYYYYYYNYYYYYYYYYSCSYSHSYSCQYDPSY